MMTSKPNHDHLLEAIYEMKMSYLMLAEALKDAKEYEYWHTEIGEGVGGLADYLSMPEIGVTVRECNEMIQVLELVRDHFPETYREVPLSTLKYMAKRGITDHEMLASAESLTPKDFRERWYDHKTGEKGDRTYKYMVMKVCNETGNMTKVHGVESEEVLEALKDKIDGQ